MASFAADFARESFLFILRDVAGTADFVRARCAALGIADARIAVLDAPTAGQAETVELGLATVSYTHLDVYKRQAPCASCMAIR